MARLMMFTVRRTRNKIAMRCQTFSLFISASLKQNPSSVCNPKRGKERRLNVLWLYQIPNWQLGLLVTGTFTLLSVAGFLLTRKWVRGFKSHHNDVVSSFVATIG